MKKYIVVSGLNLSDNNRGTAALGFGAISFLYKNGYLSGNQELLNFRYYNKLWKWEYYKNVRDKIIIDNHVWYRNLIYVSTIEKKIYDKFGLLFPWSKFGKSLRNVDLVANINGGDGFSDIYSTDTFLSRLTDTWIAIKENIPFILLPQTLGPFEKIENFKIAKNILKKAAKIYVRDDKFERELRKIGVEYKNSRDLSAYMLPAPWDFKVNEGSIGINISGLAYSNKFRTLSGQFTFYPLLIDCLIMHFQKKGLTIYLIPHSYNYDKPELNNDDMVACRLAYRKLKSKTNVILVDKNLSSPQVKYVISKMSFFIGTRMHANFAAIYTHVPLFGLAYSYKFAGAFSSNGLNVDKQTAMINNIDENMIEGIVQKVESFYLEVRSSC